MIVRPRGAVRAVPVVIAVRIPAAMVIVTVIAAVVGGLRIGMEVIHREHTAAEPGDHAEHQQPWKPTAHGFQETPRC